MTKLEAARLRDKLYEQLKASTDIVELKFLALKIEILTAHLRGDLPL